MKDAKSLAPAPVRVAMLPTLMTWAARLEGFDPPVTDPLVDDVLGLEPEQLASVAAATSTAAATRASGHRRGRRTGRTPPPDSPVTGSPDQGRRSLRAAGRRP